MKIITYNQHEFKLFTPELQKIYAESFDCGNTALSAFLKAPQSLDDSFGKNYVMISDKDIIGYYNLSTGHIEIPAVPEAVRAGGAIYINCLAIDKRFQKKKDRNILPV